MSVPEPAADKVVELPQLGSKEHPFPRRAPAALKQALETMHIDVRFNLRSRRVEWNGIGPPDDAKWHAVNSRSLAELRTRIAERFFVKGAEGKPAAPLYYGREAFADQLDALLYHKEFDPLEHWLVSVPTWDGQERLAGLIFELFDTTAGQLAIWASRYLVLAVIQRTFEPGCKLDEIPVFIGGQGIGKSAMLQSILPPDIPDLFGDALRWDASGKEMVEAVQGCAIVEVSEMAGRRRAEIEHIKSFITRRDDGHVRLAYAAGTEPLPRRFVMAATTNNETDLPNDPSGNRRFVPVPLAGNRAGSIERFMERWRDQLWAEGMAFYLDGVRANLPRDLHAEQRHQAELHRDRDDVLEDAIRVKIYGHGPHTMADIYAYLGETAKGVSQQRMGRALRNAGWELKRTKAARQWTLTG